MTDRNLVYGIDEATLSGGTLTIPVSKKAFLFCQTAGTVNAIETDGLLRDGLCLTLINTADDVLNFEYAAAKGTAVARAIQADGAATLIRVSGEWRIV